MGETIRYIIGVACVGLAGGVMAAPGITCAMWEFWVIELGFAAGYTAIYWM